MCRIICILLFISLFLNSSISSGISLETQKGSDDSSDPVVQISATKTVNLGKIIVDSDNFPHVWFENAYGGDYNNDGYSSYTFEVDYVIKCPGWYDDGYVWWTIYKKDGKKESFYQHYGENYLDGSWSYTSSVSGGDYFMFILRGTDSDFSGLISTTAEEEIYIYIDDKANNFEKQAVIVKTNDDDPYGDTNRVKEQILEKDGTYDLTYQYCIITESNLKNELNRMAEKSNSKTISFFYYSGHGGSDSTGEYLCTSGSNFYDYEFLQILDKFQGKVVVILSSCHSGGMAESERYSLKNSENIVIFASCPKTGLEYLTFWFEEHVANALRGGADYNNDNVVTVEETYKYVKLNIYSDYTNSLQLFDDNPGEDIPIIGIGNWLFEPDLDCEYVSSDFLYTGKPGSTFSTNFKVKNVGDTDSKLDWYIDNNNCPDGMIFSPISGNNLEPEDGSIIVEVRYTLPNQNNWAYSSSFIVYNQDNYNDYVNINFNFKAEKSKSNNEGSSKSMNYKAISVFLDIFQIIKEKQI